MGPQDEPVFFSNALEGMRKSFGAKITPELLAKLKQLGIDFDALMPAYPLYTGEEVIKLIAAELYPDLAPEQQWERMGDEWLIGYLDTMLGRAAFALARTIGPRRALERMSKNFKTASNYLSSDSVVHGPTDVEVRTFVGEPYIQTCANRPSVMLHYRAGIIRQCMTQLRVRNASVNIESWEPSTQTARYRIRWEA